MGPNGVNGLAFLCVCPCCSTVTYTQDVRIQANLTTTSDIATTNGECDGRLPTSQSYCVTDHQDAAFSLAIAAGSSNLLRSMRPSTWRNSTTFSSDASVRPCLPAVPMAAQQRVPDKVMTAAPGASISWCHSQSLVAIDLFQPVSIMLEVEWNCTTTQTRDFPWPLPCPTHQLDLPWAVSKTPQLHSRPRHTEVGQDFWLVCCRI